MKGMKHLEGVFLERKFDSDIPWLVPKKPESKLFFTESAVFLAMQLESKKEHFEFTDEELLMIIKCMNYRIKHNYLITKHNYKTYVLN